MLLNQLEGNCKTFFDKWNLIYSENLRRPLSWRRPNRWRLKQFQCTLKLVWLQLLFICTYISLSKVIVKIVTYNGKQKLVQCQAIPAPQSRSAPDSWALAKLPCLPRTGFRIQIHSSREVLLRRAGSTPEVPGFANRWICVSGTASWDSQQVPV